MSQLMFNRFQISLVAWSGLMPCWRIATWTVTVNNRVPKAILLHVKKIRAVFMDLLQGWIVWPYYLPYLRRWTSTNRSSSCVFAMKTSWSFVIMSQDSIVTVTPEICHIQKFGTSLDMPPQENNIFAARTRCMGISCILWKIQRGIAANPPYHDISWRFQNCPFNFRVSKCYKRYRFPGHYDW